MWTELVGENPWCYFTQHELRIRRKAAELAGDVHPMFNLQPYIDAVRSADALGLDVVRRDAQRQNDG